MKYFFNPLLSKWIEPAALDSRRRFSSMSATTVRRHFGFKPDDMF